MLSQTGVDRLPCLRGLRADVLVPSPRHNQRRSHYFFPCYDSLRGDPISGEHTPGTPTPDQKSYRAPVCLRPRPARVNIFI
ncbi:hypothetical protein E2C01_029894 [Portunus trituberculatus]|uniref:Uncharacterized protein n=1 Tax=Portunus trituberculatus TaxID=210409 RepID=A0A5B7ETF8_PORTR|nr:hypothetical protein [Portunus trituberculatus]